MPAFLVGSLMQHDVYYLFVATVPPTLQQYAWRSECMLDIFFLFHSSPSALGSCSFHHPPKPRTTPHNMQIAILGHNILLLIHGVSKQIDRNQHGAERKVVYKIKSSFTLNNIDTLFLLLLFFPPSLPPIPPSTRKTANPPSRSLLTSSLPQGPSFKN